MANVLASADARAQLPKLIDHLVGHPDEVVEFGRQRRREVVLMAADHYDEILQVQETQRDLAWALFAHDRIEHPTSAPVSWEDAQRRRRRRDA